MSKARLQIFTKLVFLIIFIVTWFAINYLFNELNTGIIAAISGAIAFLVSPRIKKIDSQSGELIQLKWMLLKKLVIAN
ncbi:hypothetical protein LB452_05715 [Psychroflexus sp. CAK8W]|uniref:Uncharacterized protein n=1 Tax=Psychroflexus longus TaxID=2873596 RepID=A0ABS7XHI7_9FLAO|nr:hypothetical protein [Psychroflexus longus]MBZ9778417.1 hypothetical protein [Psychroflexus longus]